MLQWFTFLNAKANANPIDNRQTEFWLPEISKKVCSSLDRSYFWLINRTAVCCTSQSVKWKHKPIHTFPTFPYQIRKWYKMYKHHFFHHLEGFKTSLKMTLCITVSQQYRNKLYKMCWIGGTYVFIYFYFILFFRLPTSQQHSPSLCCWCWSSEEWHFLEPSMVSSITFTLIHLGLLTLRYC